MTLSSVQTVLGADQHQEQLMPLQLLLMRQQHQQLNQPPLLLHQPPPLRRPPLEHPLQQHQRAVAIFQILVEDH